MIKITAVIVDRANYGRLQPLLQAFEDDKDFELSIICCGSTVLKRFHIPAVDIAGRFNVTHYLYHEVEGSNTLSAVNSMSMLMPQLSMALQQNEPEYLLIIGDRFETLTVATVATMLKICICHVQGGEHSGNIDNSIRHAITKLSHYHLPAHIDAKKLLERMGEGLETILGVGCPVADLIAKVKRNKKLLKSLLCVYHPEDGVNNSAVVRQLLNALSKTNREVLMLWPNIDMEAEGVTKTIRRYIEEKKPNWLKMFVNFTPSEYLSILASVTCCVGNSSSFVRDASFFGTSVILLGNRQLRRVKTNNVKVVQYPYYDMLHLAINVFARKTFEPSNVYGVAGVSKSFVEKLKLRRPYHLKVSYV